MNRKIFTFLLILILLSSNLMAKNIKLWHAWVGPEKEALLGIITEYEQISGNKIIVESYNIDSLQARFLRMVDEGLGPDLIIGPSDWIGTFAHEEVIASIDEYLKEGEESLYIQTVINGCKYNGKLYGLPESFKCLALIYNKDLVVSPPETIEELLKIGKTLTDEDEMRYGLVYDIENYYYQIPWINGFGGEILDSKNNPTFTSKEQQNSLNFVYSLQHGENKIMPSEINYNMVMTIFNFQLAGMMINGPWVIGDLIKSDINFGIAKLPKVSKTGKWSGPAVGAEVIMMSSNAKDRSATYDFIKFLTSENTQIKMATAGHLPSRKNVYNNDELKNIKIFEYIKGFKEQSEVGIPIPNALEMNIAVWQNGTIMLKEILSNDVDIIKATKAAQEKSIKLIQENLKK